MTTTQISEPELDLKLIWQAFRRRKGIIALFSFISLLIATLVAIISPPSYVAVSKFVYQTSAKSGSGLNALASLAGMNLNTSNDASAYIVDIVKSGDMVGKLIDTSWNVSLATPDTNTPITLEELWKIKTDTTKDRWKDRKREGMLSRLLSDNYIALEQDKKTGVFYLTTEFEDPKLSKTINEFIIRELNNTLVAKMVSKASVNRSFIEDRLKDVKLDLIRSENALTHYRERNRDRLNPYDQLQESRLQRDVLINTQIMGELQKQFELAKIEEAKDMPVLEIVDPPRTPIEKNKPKRKKILMIGLLAGVLFGCCFAVGADFISQRRA